MNLPKKRKEKEGWSVQNKNSFCPGRNVTARWDPSPLYLLLPQAEASSRLPQTLFPQAQANRAPPCSSPGNNRHRPFSFTNSRPAAGFRAGGGGAVSSREFFILLFRD
jgi:hypothetical protein